MSVNHESEFQLGSRKARIALSPSCNLRCNYCGGAPSRQLGKPGAMEDFRAGLLSETGNIDTPTYIEIIRSLYKVGFRGITFTGGEPTLNKDWDVIARAAQEIGMEQICLTTNGLQLLRYLSEHDEIPSAITLLTVSFDTFNSEEFRTITLSTRLNDVINGLQLVRERNPKLKIRANKVCMASNISQLRDFINKAEAMGLFDEINLLNLICKDTTSSQEKAFVEKEFVHPDKVIELLTSELKLSFVDGEKYEPEAYTASGVRIIIKDTNRTLRQETICGDCPIYCQEGLYTIRVGTDGSIRTCIDYYNVLPWVDGRAAIASGDLEPQMQKLTEILVTSQLDTTLQKFFSRHSIELLANE